MAREHLPIRQPEQLSVLPDRVWTAEEWDVIKAGHISSDMDDRWDVVVEGDHLRLQQVIQAVLLSLYDKELSARINDLG